MSTFLEDNIWAMAQNLEPIPLYTCQNKVAFCFLQGTIEIRNQKKSSEENSMGVKQNELNIFCGTGRD